MRYTITKFKMESGKFDITYTKYVQGMDEQHSLKSYEKPRPEFKEAHVTMKALLLSKFGAFKFAQNMVAVSGIEFRYGGKDFLPDEVSGIKVKGYLRNKESEVCVFSTKWLDICLGLLGHCDILVLCDGWEQSRGCKGEYEYAQKHDKAIFKLDEWKALNRI